MLSSSYLASCADGLVELYSQLENEIISDMARRLAKLGKVTDATEYQAKIYQEIGGLQTDILSKLKKYDTKTQKQLMSLFDEALQKSAQKDLAKLNKAGLSDSQQQILDATVKKVASAGIVNGSAKVKEDAEKGYIKVFTGVQRATMTIASSMSNEFVTQANNAYMKVASGAFDYNTALKQGVDELAKKGVYTVEYTDSGKQLSRTIEGMLRTNIMTGINQTASQVTLDNAQDLECDLVEVSAHMGARPSHEAFQGKIYSLSGESKKYPSFYEVCQPGSPTGICGINCRHSYYPYFEGMPRMYEDGELDEMKDSKVTYNGKKITQYEAEQQQRAIERNIRKYKRQADAEGIAGLDNTEARQKIKEWQNVAKDFTKQTGLRRDYAREYIGTATGKQIRGLKANKADSTATPQTTTTEKITIDPIKFTGYALDPVKSKGKAVAFEKALGYNKDNADALITKIKQEIDITRFVEKGDLGHGMRYEQVMEIIGPNSKKAHVLTAWIDTENGKKRLTSVYVTKKDLT